jgi:hypothetical protein
MAKIDKTKRDEISLAPMAGGAPESCLEIDAVEYEKARRDPVVRKLLEKADRYAESLRSQGRLDD